MSNLNKIEDYMEIPIVVLDHHYYINDECDIKCYNNGKVYDVYSWTKTSACKLIKLHDYVNNVDIDLMPCMLYLITMYGYCRLDVETYDVVHPSEYRYEIPIPIQKTENDLLIGNEIFKRVPSCPNIFISEFGCCYNMNKDTFSITRLKSKLYNYKKCNATKKDVHKMVYEAWVGELISGNDIHHIDNNEWNNHYTNLVQLSRQEHMKIHGNVVLTESEVRTICDLLMTKPPADVADELNIPRWKILNIYNRINFKEISKNYKFPFYEFSLATQRKLSDSEINDICKLLEESKLSNKEIGLLYNVNKYTTQDIRCGNTWKNISKNYSFERKPDLFSNFENDHKSSRNSKINENDVKIIWDKLLFGMSISEIVNEGKYTRPTIQKIKLQYRWKWLTDQFTPLPSN